MPYVKFYENWSRFRYPLRMTKIAVKAETPDIEKADGSSGIRNETQKILISKV